LIQKKIDFLDALPLRYLRARPHRYRASGRSRSRQQKLVRNCRLSSEIKSILSRSVPKNRTCFG